MTKNSPLVSVLLPVFNCEKYLAEAIDSILQQDFTDFELLIIEGGSKDKSMEIIEKYDDPRIQVIKQDKNTKGVAAAANQGLDLARGKYIARIDCDDINLPNRLTKQVKFMEDNPNIGISGAWMKTIGTKSQEIIKYPTSHEEIKAMLFFMPPIAQPTVIMRKSKLKEHNLKYDPNFIIGEDFDLWSRSSFQLTLANLPEILLIYRKHPISLYSTHKNKHPNLFYPIYKRHLEQLGIPFELKDYDFVRACITSNLVNVELTWDFFEKANQWLHLVLDANKKNNVYIEPFFSENLAKNWFWICYKFRRFGYQVFKIYKKSGLKKYSKIPLILRLRCRFLTFLFQIKFIRKWKMQK
ncbi:MAG: glycosyltransferase [Asgard group archaeon]|nr:glycosyltransferase [Asgard group archaeon]